MPTIVLVLANNQAPNARNLAHDGAVELLPMRGSAALIAARRSLASDFAARLRGDNKIQDYMPDTLPIDHDGSDFRRGEPLTPDMISPQMP